MQQSDSCGRPQVGTPEFDDRFNRAKNKFFQKYTAAAAVSTPATPAAAGPPSSEAKEEASQLKAEGNKHLGAKNLPEALRCYTAAIALDPTNHIFFGNRAAVHTQLKDFESAIADCKSALALDDTYVKAYSRIGLAHYQMGQYEPSVENYKRACELAPDNQQYKADYDGAVAKMTPAGGPVRSNTRHRSVCRSLP